MSRYARPIGSGIPIWRVRLLENLDIASAHCLVIVTGNPVFRTSMTEPQAIRRQLGDDIIRVSDPIQRALLGDILS